MSRQAVPFLKFKPDSLNDTAWRALIEAWENGFSNREAAFCVCEKDGATEITPAELDELCANSADLSDLQVRLTTKSIRKAKTNIKEALDDEDTKIKVSTSKWLLEKKAADEFCSKSAVELNNAVVTLSLEDKKKAAEQYLENLENDE